MTDDRSTAHAATSGAPAGPGDHRSGADDAPLLEIRGLSKSFPGVRALDGVDFRLHAGEVHALLGENGAGKSTLIKVLTGVHARDGGEIRLGGVPIDAADTADAQRLGIGTVYQEVNLLPNLSVADNLYLGREPTRFGLRSARRTAAMARELLAGYGLSIDVTANLGDYSVAVQQIVAIARAVDLSGKVLVLDEPTASLDAGEVQTLFGIVRRLTARGIGVVFVTHFLDQVFALCDRATVLRNGRLVGERRIAELGRLELVTMMLGRELEAAQLHRRRGEGPKGEAFLAFEGFGRHAYVNPFDLEIRPSEVTGVAGLLGSGRTETAKLLFGIKEADAGSATADGAPLRLASPRAAVAAGFAFCPEDRKTEGIVGDLSVRENIMLALQARRGWLNPLSRGESKALADRFIKALDIRTPDAEKPIRLLSGGNQQKALLARWLATEPRFLILDEPTRGIDVGAHAEIIRLIERLCDEGLALLVISSEIDEIVAYSDRVLVLRDRAHVGMIEGADVTVDRIVGAIAAEGPATAAGVPA
ncbi:galactofuranose ABC transporter, ATP-binding protein YtfR [Methylobrevis albus]|uniref:Sugar ABC transporter ATP-binding protein n=1 Tax=Methylobrevis albus TaxID=2793297 RepID=A0A931MX20_9HYPH|nr:galactofuranose ABC transporter, ATP-binding protein YtfR [Methylobrevis albus]MBH0238328.1 sugar ABC transporter ATP-binding protein [Methylobrevis albus]